MKSYQDLDNDFVTQRIAFKSFEEVYLRSKKSNKPKDLDGTIEKFSDWLKIFTDLYYDMTLEGSLKQTAERETHEKNVDGLTMIINKIQFIYILPLTQRLNTINNRINIRVAVGSIAFGLVCTIGSLVYSHFDAQSGQNEIGDQLHAIAAAEQRILVKDSLINSKLTKDTIFIERKLIVKKKKNNTKVSHASPDH